MGITGAAFIALSIFCFCRPGATVLSMALLIGIFTLISGAATFCNWIWIRSYFPQSGSVLLSSILQIAIGIIFLNYNMEIATALPYIFAFFLIIEGINIAIRSFDYKKIGFKVWWLALTFGILAAVLGVFSLRQPYLVGGSALSITFGIGLLLIGCFYIVALFGIGKFEKKLRSNPWIDEQ